MKSNKGYTIMEAVIAMFLVVVMVGAVFSALMAGRRAIVSSSEREEIFYSLNSAYGMLKDCRSNTQYCRLANFGTTCPHGYLSTNQSLQECEQLFTFGFANLCKGAAPDNNVGTFQYHAVNSDIVPQVQFSSPTASGNGVEAVQFDLPDFYILQLEAQCTEGL